MERYNIEGEVHRGPCFKLLKVVQRDTGDSFVLKIAVSADVKPFYLERLRRDNAISASICKEGIK